MFQTKMKAIVTISLISVLVGCNDSQSETDSRPSADASPVPSAKSSHSSEGNTSPASLEEQLIGTWTAVRGEAQGEPTLLEGFSFTFDGTRFKAGSPHRTTEGEYKIDTTKTPMQIIFTGFGLGIFEFRSGQLFLCIDRDVRPTKFATSPSSYEILTVCERNN